jgi:thiol-disulfide isomerase/thioredoxin
MLQFINFICRCEPCKLLTPKLAELLEENPDIDLAIVDVDTNIE